MEGAEKTDLETALERLAFHVANFDEAVCRDGVDNIGTMTARANVVVSARAVVNTWRKAQR